MNNACAKGTGRSSRWRPRRTILRAVIYSLQLGLGRIFFDSVVSRVGSALASAAALKYAGVVKKVAPYPVRITRGHGLAVVEGLPRHCYPRGGICIGRVFLTGPTPSPRVLRHEVRHVHQWETYGLLMPFLYWFAGSNPRKNWFEIEAGLEDGGYL